MNIKQEATTVAHLTPFQRACRKHINKTPRWSVIFEAIERELSRGPQTLSSIEQACHYSPLTIEFIEMERIGLIEAVEIIDKQPGRVAVTLQGWQIKAVK